MQIPFLFRSIKMPDYVVWETVDAVAGDFCEFGESFGFDLVVDGFEGEIDAWVVSLLSTYVKTGKEIKVVILGSYLYDAPPLVREDSRPRRHREGFRVGRRCASRRSWPCADGGF